MNLPVKLLLTQHETCAETASIEHMSLAHFLGQKESQYLYIILESLQVNLTTGTKGVRRAAKVIAPLRRCLADVPGARLENSMPWLRLGTA